MPTLSRPAVIETDQGLAILKVGRPILPAKTLGMEFVSLCAAEACGVPVPRSTFLPVSDAWRSQIQTASYQEQDLQPASSGIPIDHVVTQGTPGLAIEHFEGVPWDHRETAKGLITAGSVAALLAVDSWLLNDDRFPCPITRTGQHNEKNLLVVPGGHRRRRILAIDYGNVLRGGRVPVGTPVPFGLEVVYGTWPTLLDNCTLADVEDAAFRVIAHGVEAMHAAAALVPDSCKGSETEWKASLDYLESRAHALHTWLPFATKRVMQKWSADPPAGLAWQDRIPFDRVLP